MNIQAQIRELNKKAKEQSEPFAKVNEMPYLKELWSHRHATVREMWSNPNFTHREAFQVWTCSWYFYTSLDSDEYLSHQEFYEEMKKFSCSDKAAPKLSFPKLWRAINCFFALYYLEFPFWIYPNPPQFEYNSVKAFFKSLSE